MSMLPDALKNLRTPQELVDKLRDAVVNRRPDQPEKDWSDDLAEQARAQAVAAQVKAATAVRARSLPDFSDAEMVMDMIRRGYAVMKLPEGGGPPEVLKK